MCVCKYVCGGRQVEIAMIVYNYMYFWGGGGGRGGMVDTAKFNVNGFYQAAYASILTLRDRDSPCCLPEHNSDINPHTH